MPYIRHDQYGYPTERSLKRLKKAINDNFCKEDGSPTEAVRLFYEALGENYCGSNYTGLEIIDWNGKPMRVWGYHTGGWSGNEDIIRTLEQTPLFSILLVRYDRGGHYYFELPDRWLLSEQEIVEGSKGEA